MGLTDEHREWLDAAVRGRSEKEQEKFEKDFANYKRRRRNVSGVFSKLPLSHSNYRLIFATLGRADNRADKGLFESAYKLLDSAKQLVQESLNGESGEIETVELERRVGRICNLLEKQKGFPRSLTKLTANVLSQYKSLKMCSDMPALSDAIEHRKTILARLPDLWRAMDDAEAKAHDLAVRVSEQNIQRQIMSVRTEFRTLKQFGYDKTAREYERQVETALSKFDETRGVFVSKGLVSEHFKTAKRECETVLRACRKLTMFDEKSQEPSVRAKGTQSSLRKMTAKQIREKYEREEARLEGVIKGYYDDCRRDEVALSKKGSVPLELTPEQPDFRMDALLRDFSIRAVGLVSEEYRMKISRAASKKMEALLASKSTPQSVLLDLMSKDQAALKADIAKCLFGEQKIDELSHKKKLFVVNLSAAMIDSVNEHAPNKVNPGGVVVNMGGTDFKKVKILKSGGLGTAILFEEAASGKREDSAARKRIVMKTPKKGNKEAFADLLKEMKIMNRAQEGAAKSPGKSAIPEFYGAARGDDGSMHMLMEYIDGGDMGEVADTMGALASSGFLPPAAHTALQADLVADAAQALVELHRQGLLHHDFKGANIMLTKTGKVRIIDYGASTFVGKDGTLKAKEMSHQRTAGYIGKDGREDGATVTVDDFALGSMLLDMVGQTMVKMQNKDEPEGGALGRLISTLHDTADKRVSLEGLAESALITAAHSEFGSKAMAQLRATAIEFTQDVMSLKSDKTFAVLKDQLGHVTAFSYFAKADKPLGIDSAQSLAKLINEDIGNIMRVLQPEPQPSEPSARNSAAISKGPPQRYTSERRDRLAKLVKAKTYLQTQVIDKMLNTALEKADAAYRAALEDSSKSFEFDVEGKKRDSTLRQAVSAHTSLSSKIEECRKNLIDLLKKGTEIETAPSMMIDEDDAKLRKDICKLKEKLKTLVAQAKLLQAQIEKAAGPAAKIFFSKARLDAAIVPFGPSAKRQTQRKTAKDEIVMTQNIEATVFGKKSSLTSTQAVEALSLLCAEIEKFSELIKKLNEPEAELRTEETGIAADVLKGRVAALKTEYAVLEARLGAARKKESAELRTQIAGIMAGPTTVHGSGFVGANRGEAEKSDEVPRDGHA